MNDPTGPSQDPPGPPPDPAGPSPDWDSVFHQARRQVFTRVLLVGAVAALGALFLLGGGLSAQGTVSWRFLGHQTEAKSKPPPKHKNEHQHKQNGGKHSDQGKHTSGQSKHSHSGSGNNHHRHKQKQPQKHPHYHQWNPCPSNSAASQQYCDAEETAAPSNEPTGASELSGGG